MTPQMRFLTAEELQANLRKTEEFYAANKHLLGEGWIDRVRQDYTDAIEIDRTKVQLLVIQPNGGRIYRVSDNVQISDECGSDGSRVLTITMRTSG